MKMLDVKPILTDNRLLEILAPSVFNPTEERLKGRAEKYMSDKSAQAYACQCEDGFAGLIVFKIVQNAAVITDIATAPLHRSKGVGTFMIQWLFESFDIEQITAETDDDAVDFYRKRGFKTEKCREINGITRYNCVKERTTK